SLGVSQQFSSAETVSSLINQLRRHFQHVLIEAIADEPPTPWLLEWLLRSDGAYLFLQPNTQDISHLDLLTRELRSRNGKGGDHFKTILCRAEAQGMDGFDLVVQRVASPVHMFVHDCPTLATGSLGTTSPAFAVT